MPQFVLHFDARSNALNRSGVRTCRLLRILLCLCTFAYESAIAAARNSHSTSQIVVVALINGVKANFVVDKGADRSMWDEQFALRLGLHPAATIEVDRPYGIEVDGVVQLDELDLQSTRYRNLPMFVTNLGNESKATGVEIDGVVGADVLRRSLVTLDFRAHTAIFQRRSHLHTGTPIKLRNVDNRSFASIAIKGTQLDLLLDTGTDISVLSGSAWQKMSPIWTSTEIVHGIRSSTNTSNVVLVCASDVLFSQDEYRNVPMRIASKDAGGALAASGLDGLLGTEFLKRFHVQLDLAAGMIYVKPDSSFKPHLDLRRFSTIGIQFVKDPSGGVSVVAVWSGGPAADAGLKIGDLVSSVNGASTFDMKMDDFSQRLHGQPEQRVQLTITSSGSTRSVDLTIRQLLCRSQ